MSRILKAGTAICLAGSQLELILPEDTKVNFPQPDTDEAFIGRLIRHPENFRLNIDSVEGIWSPVTGARDFEEERVQAEEAANNAVEEKAAPAPKKKARKAAKKKAAKKAA